MNSMTYDFAVIGGDLRQVYMAEDLSSRGFSVLLYGLENLCSKANMEHAKSLAQAIDSSKVILTPIPFTKNGIHILSVDAKADLTPEILCTHLKKGHMLYGGCFTKNIREFCEASDIYYNDFMEEEEITLFNTIATAEGTIAEAIIGSDGNLHGSSCLILGYGRCAKTLAEKLKVLCGQLTIAARSPLAIAQAKTSSFNAVSLPALTDVISEYDYIFNTIPAPVLGRELLEKTKQDVTIIDIASAPGGVDFTAAKELSRNARLCLGLPGKYSPKASAAFLTKYLLSSLGEKAV
ncbi:dipicolinate synthase subunit DpsA [Anaerocolumna xylanovorans]|uniref:Dipicolinate synthase subunit A n=1 Tax=Anaerocolumna xylanovorans DSM 12503 TaxID=1121345 RepID=A0A1M7YN61_9FIRM|nr:dipicolinate synthase subunit DpsA [Anaerocolumna xylanovorans]SHO54027.1 dipicolinate synthase subunit A [Anaerocolumna xylanovorans DSM 12503]